jgi:amidase
MTGHGTCLWRRRHILVFRRCVGPALLTACLAALPVLAQTPGAPHQFDVYEAGIPELQAALRSGRVTSVQLVDAYLARIAAYDHAGPVLNAILRINPRAREEAQRLDAERRAGHLRGPLHGIPVIVKDNYGTHDMPTSAGSVALAFSLPRADAFQIARLREAGAIILAKANMHELASGITTISSLGGQTRNPYDPARYPGGSSGGSAVAAAASFAAIAYGSDTCGSIRIPAAFNDLFGLRPTKGLSSIAGIVPLSHTQDVAGPLARTVTDLAIGLDATVGPDPEDRATHILDGRAVPSFQGALDSTALRGARLGVLTEYFGTEHADAEADSIVHGAIARMKEAGAQVMDVVIPGLDSLVAGAYVIDMEFRFDLEDYLAGIPNAPVHSLDEILSKGLFHEALSTSLHRRDTVRTRGSEAYRTALARRDSARELVVQALDAQHLDAIVYPTMLREPALIGQVQTGSTCFLSAVTGLPALSAPAGFTGDGLPLGVELLGRPLDDAKLVALAFSYEQAVHPRHAPERTPPLVDGHAPVPVPVRLAGGESPLAVEANLTFDVTRAALDYTIRLRNLHAAQVAAIGIHIFSAQGRGPMLFRLSGPGAVSVKGEHFLDRAERDALRSGSLELVLYTREHPLGVDQGQLQPVGPGDPGTR